VDRKTAARLDYAADLLVKFLDSPRPDESDLVHADQLFTAALAACFPDDESVPAGLHDHASVLLWLFRITGDPELLTRAIDREREAIERSSPDHPGLCVMRVSLAAMLGEALPSSYREGDLTELRALVSTVVPMLDGHPERAALTTKLANAMLACPNPDVDEVERLVRVPLAAGSNGGIETAKLQILLATVLYRRFGRSGDLVVLNMAIEIVKEGVALALAAKEVRVAGLLMCAGLQQIRWRRTDDLSDLKAAVDLRLAAAEVGPTPAQIPDLHTGLSTALRDRFERCGDPRDLDAAVTAGRLAVRARSQRAEQQARCLANLSAVYRTRFEHSRRSKDVSRAVRTAREAVEASELGGAERPRHLSTLTLALLCDFSLRRDRCSADEAMVASREALATIGTGYHPLRPALLANAANSLRARHEWTGDLTDLNESVSLLRESVTATGTDDVARFRRRAGLCAALLRRFESTGLRADIDGAVREARRELKEAPGDHGQRLGLGMNLGLALYRRFEAYGIESDLRECLRSYAETVEATPSTHPDRDRWLSQLSAPLREFYLLTGADEDLTAAIASAAEAVRGAGDGGAWFNLGMALSLLYEREKLNERDTDAGRAAEGAFAQAVMLDGTAPWIRAAAAVRLARLSGERGTWAIADAAYGEALNLLPVLTSRQLGWDSRQRQLARLAGLGADAAAVAVQLGDKERAVLILEQARGILIGQSIEQQQDVAAIRQVDERLADEFLRLSELLAADTEAASEVNADLTTFADPTAARRDLATRWEAVIETIRRTVTGQERFLAPPEIGDLLTVSADGPVVIVNLSRHRCDAVILRDNDIEIIPLSESAWREGGLLAEKYLAATAVNDEGTNEVVRDTLDWLWKIIADPVIEKLSPSVQRVWWMPTGVLSALPLHAAQSKEDGGPAVMDRVVSSTTTTLRALVDARSRPAEKPDAETLIVAMSETPGHKPLFRAAQEVEDVAGHVGGRVRTLKDGNASSLAVRDGLRTAVWAHLVCHAISNLVNPQSGALLLAHGRLTVRDIAALPRRHRYLAYVSACTTAQSGGLLVDEAMHLASAFQLIGFRTVIGTLWQVDDDAARQVANSYYSQLSSGQEPAVALHNAVRDLRNQYPQGPALWAGFVHFGP
jgi:CHAT domain-containing protein